MCRPTACRTCGETTWAGCGQHVDQVMARVPADRRCRCDADAGRRQSTGRTRRRGLFRR